MVETFSEAVSVTDSSGKVRIKLNGKAGIIEVYDDADKRVFEFNSRIGRLILGNQNNGSSVWLRDSNGKVRTNLNGKVGIIEISDDARKKVFDFDSRNGTLKLGNQNNDGRLWLRDSNNKPRIKLNGKAGTIDVNDDANQRVFDFRSRSGTLILGNQNNGGSLSLRDSNGKDRTILDGKVGLFEIRDNSRRRVFEFFSGRGRLQLGNQNNPGDLRVRDSDGKVRIRLHAGNAFDVNDDANERVFDFDSRNGTLKLGNQNNGGCLRLRDFRGKPRTTLDGKVGFIEIYDDADERVFYFDSRNGTLKLGNQNNGGHLWLRDSNGKVRISLNSEIGDIELSGADCAEFFDVSESGQIEPGTVMVADKGDILRPSKEAYDKKVVGVVSGAVESKPGILLNKKPTESKTVPVALTGKVFCKVDADYSPIEVGDLLTTSPTAGHAMKASDSSRAFGAVIGKALGTLRESKGVIPILVGLQ